MWKWLMIALTVLLAGGHAFAQTPGSIGLYADPTGTDCNLYDLMPQVIQFHVVHVNTTGAQASRFKAPVPTCMNGAIWLSDETGWPIKIGLVPDGTIVGYGGCITGPIHVMTINIFGQGLSSSCCYYPILPDPSGLTGYVEVEGCDDVWRPATGGEGIVNPTPECMCDVPSDETTWSRVKSLYTR